MKRRSFLKGLLCAPFVALVPGVLKGKPEARADTFTMDDVARRHRLSGVSHKQMIETLALLAERRGPDGLPLYDLTPYVNEAFGFSPSKPEEPTS